MPCVVCCNCAIANGEAMDGVATFTFALVTLFTQQERGFGVSNAVRRVKTWNDSEGFLCLFSTPGDSYLCVVAHHNAIGRHMQDPDKF